MANDADNQSLLASSNLQSSSNTPADTESDNDNNAPQEAKEDAPLPPPNRLELWFWKPRNVVGIQVGDFGHLGLKCYKDRQNYFYISLYPDTQSVGRILKFKKAKFELESDDCRRKKTEPDTVRDGRRRVDQSGKCLYIDTGEWLEEGYGRNEPSHILDISELGWM